MFVFYFRFLNNKYKAKIKYKHFKKAVKGFYYPVFLVPCVAAAEISRKRTSEKFL